MGWSRTETPWSETKEPRVGDREVGVGIPAWLDETMT